MKFIFCNSWSKGKSGWLSKLTQTYKTRTLCMANTVCDIIRSEMETRTLINNVVYKISAVRDNSQRQWSRTKEIERGKKQLENTKMLSNKMSCFKVEIRMGKQRRKLMECGGLEMHLNELNGEYLNWAIEIVVAVLLLLLLLLCLFLKPIGQFYGYVFTNEGG